MNTAIPLIALAVAIVALVLSPPPEPKPSKPNFLASLLILVIAVGAGILWRADYFNLLPTALAFGAGIVVAAKLRFLEGFRVASPALAISTATVLAGLCSWLSKDYNADVQLALIAGLGIGAWACGDLRPSAKLGSGAMTALAASVLIAVDFMGEKGLATDAGKIAGTMFGLAASIAALLALVTSRSSTNAKEGASATTSFVGVATLLILGYVVGGRLMENQEAWMIFCGSVAAAGVLHWVIRPDGTDDTLPFLFGTIIWVGIATLAFSNLKGFGIAIAAAGAVSTLTLLGNRRALLSAGPLIGLAFYRVLRETYPDTAKALDIGQHYAVIGVAFGASIALLPAEWAERRNEETMRFALGRFLWAVLLCLIPVAMAIILGPKGIVGFIAGLGFAGAIEGLRRGLSLTPMVISVGLAGLVFSTYGWLEKLLDMTRETKQVAFYWMAGVAAVLVLLIASVSKTESAPESQ